MIRYPVAYCGKIKEKVDSFNDLPISEKSGSYWDKTDDGELRDVKKYIKDHYIAVQDYICPYCLQRNVVEHNGAWDAEHIIPKDSHPQFMFHEKNLCVSCKDCNGEKLNKNILKNPRRKTFPTESEDYLIVHPHIDEYGRHIRVIKEAELYLPKDEKGRNTVEICGLLRFVLKFANYGEVSLDLKKRMLALNGALVSTSDPLEENIILSLIELLAKEGREDSVEKYKDKFSAVQA